MSVDIIYFADTNLFLQCRPIGELAWHDISQADSVLVVVAWSVQKEIDRLKGDPGRRRAKRARAASTMLRSVVTSPALQIELRQNGPRVALTLSESRPANAPPDATADDLLVQEAVAYSLANPDKIVRLLTHDTGPMLSARRQGLPFDQIPDTWLLDPEPDEKDKRVSQLEDELRRLKKYQPAIAVSVLDDAGRAIDHIRQLVAEYLPLDSAQIDRLMADVVYRYPKQVEFEPPATNTATGVGLAGFEPLLGEKWIPPSDSAIAEYRDKSYPTWLDKVRRYFEMLHARLNARHRTLALTILLENTGLEPARNLLLEVSTSGPLVLCTPQVIKKVIGEHAAHLIDPPPDAPKGRYQSPLFDITSLGLPLLHHEHLMPFVPSINAYGIEPSDPHRFYWRPREPSGFNERWELEREEFRPNLDPATVELCLFARPADGEPIIGCLHIRASASNLPQPVHLHLPIELLGDGRPSIDIALGWGVKKRS